MLSGGDGSLNRNDPLAGYIPGFDGLRAGAVLLVMVGHAAAYRDIVPGGLGVTVFFAISGFLITTLLLNEQRTTGSIDLLKFYARRFLRLYPELLTFVVVMIAVASVVGWQSSITEKLSAVFYFFNYQYLLGDRTPLVIAYPWPHLWSLAVEEHFYFLFPFLVVLVSGNRRNLLVVVGLLVAMPLAWRIVGWNLFHLPAVYLYKATDARIDSIAWGCLLAILVRLTIERGKTVEESWFIGIPWFVLGAILLLASLIVRNQEFQSTWRYSFQGAGLFFLIANCLFDRKWRALVSMLELKPMRYIGRISYGLYLFHLPIFTLLSYRLNDNNVLFLPIASALAISVAALSYRLVDTPMKPLRRRFGSHVR